ncbi:transcription factor WRKY45-2-like [Phragmites australis]|uniref:transcription factor WRKY45-2-like n=1 Tax=Phragmites australis TaxID=29695 RepID=UPI002D784F18|nr:transcription factor WRKY45-2-like [Phragmites australis]
MASSGDGVTAERAASAVNDLIEAREGVARLRRLILQEDDHHRSPLVELVDGVLNRLSSAMSALDLSGAAAGGQSPAARSDGARQSVSSSGNTKKRSSFSRRSQQSSHKIVTASLDDGHIWRKYGQKEIQNSRHPRSYFRCTHKSNQGCNAKRHVQLCETDPSKHVVTYYGEHTCRDPSTIPLIVDAAGAAAYRANNFISFAPSCTNAASTGGASSQLAMDGSTTKLPTSWCTSDDVFSWPSVSFMQVDDLAAVVSSAGVTSTTVGSAPDCGGLGDMAGCGGTGVGSFPSSPNSLGLMVGSVESIGDDDFGPPLRMN